jgi:hypothetical protein
LGELGELFAGKDEKKVCGNKTVLFSFGGNIGGGNP